MCELVIDRQVAEVIGLAPQTTLLEDCLLLMELTQRAQPTEVEPPPCPHCRPGSMCWFHRPWLPGVRP
jgi:hypothetical protein